MAKYAPHRRDAQAACSSALGRRVSIEATTGRVLAMAQNTKFSEDAANAPDWNYSSQVYAGD